MTSEVSIVILTYLIPFNVQNTKSQFLISASTGASSVYNENFSWDWCPLFSFRLVTSSIIAPFWLFSFTETRKGITRQHCHA